MSNAKQLHREAMDSLRKADESLVQRDMELYKQYLHNALELEANAAALLKDKLSAEPTRSILYRSAASIAVSCGEYRRAEKLVIQALRGHPPVEIKNELLELFDKEIIGYINDSAVMALSKRIFDIVFSVLVILILLPVFVLIIILIKIESRGPALFHQIRVGRNNTLFRSYKFRSMRINDQNNPSNGRITKVGALMRKYGLDELPQFFNVLRGEMSVVGPRPIMARHHSSVYSSATNYFNARHYALPGITGLSESFNLKKTPRSYTQYSEKWSLLLDVKIILIAFSHAVRGQKNAYSVSDENTD